EGSEAGGGGGGAGAGGQPLRPGRPLGGASAGRKHKGKTGPLNRQWTSSARRFGRRRRHIRVRRGGKGVRGLLLKSFCFLGFMDRCPYFHPLSISPSYGATGLKESPGRAGAFRWVIYGDIWRENARNPQTLRSYPEEQITQGTDRVSAPTVGDSNRRPGLATAQRV